MSGYICNCNTTPCVCCPTTAPCTYCDLDRKNNVWVEGAVDDNGNGGVCMLDTMTESQIVGVLQCNERAREDLLKITSDPCLRQLAETVPRLSTEEPADQLQRQTNRHKDSIPFYTVFRGTSFPFAQ